MCLSVINTKVWSFFPSIFPLSSLSSVAIKQHAAHLCGFSFFWSFSAAQDSLYSLQTKKTTRADDAMIYRRWKEELGQLTVCKRGTESVFFLYGSQWMKILQQTSWIITWFWLILPDDIVCWFWLTVFYYAWLSLKPCSDVKTGENIQPLININKYPLIFMLMIINKQHFLAMHCLN